MASFIINNAEFQLEDKANEFDLPNDKTQIILHLEKVSENEFKIVNIPKRYFTEAYIIVDHIQKNHGDAEYDYVAYGVFESWKARDEFIEWLNFNNYYCKIIRVKTSTFATQVL